jgi:hypothetical protein
VSDGEVTDLLADLRSGARTLEEVAGLFRARTWTRVQRSQQASFSDRAERWDPGPNVAGSIDDLTGAYDRGELTWEQYRALADAVADSIDAEDRRRGGEPETSTSE